MRMISPNAWLLLVVGLIFCGLPMELSAQEPSSPPRPLAEYEFSDRTITFLGSRVVRAGDTANIFIELDTALWPIISLPLTLNGEQMEVALHEGKGVIQYLVQPETPTVVLKIQEYEAELTIPVVGFPLWMSLLPPLVAIALALLIREVYVSLFVGIFFGAATLAIAKGGFWTGLGSGFLASLDTYILDALVDSDHMSILVFSLLIGGMVSVVSRNGGMQGVVKRMSGLAKTPKSGQLATYAMGMVIFFDDYANSLVVGNTMRPITDKLKISREKLSFLVDATAAPVASIAFVTTWIGAEIGYISDGIKDLPGFPADQSPYLIFLQSIPYSFYSILMLLFILMLVLSGRDFGPMLKAERRARSTGKVRAKRRAEVSGQELDEFSPLPGISPKARYAAIPVLVLVLGVLGGLLYTGYSEELWNDEGSSFLKKMSETIGASNSYQALLWASLASLGTAIVMTLLGGKMRLPLVMDSMMNGFKAMMGALVILSLAWALGSVTRDMYTAGYLTDLLGRNLSPIWIPALAFLLSALVAFSTGSSWSTMAILFPLMLPLVWEASRSVGLSPAESLPLFYHTVASVLAGSVLGDHVSPISDTTILSSLASDCDHIDHVRTQMPYALVVGTIALLFGALPAGLGLSPWVAMAICLALLGLIIWRVGRKVGSSESVNVEEKA